MKTKIFACLMTLAAALFAVSCSSDDDYSVATGTLVSGVTTGSSDVTANTATLHATVEGNLSGMSSSSYQVAFRFGPSEQAMTTTVTTLNGQEFSTTIEDLVEDQTYYYQAVLTLQGKVTYTGEMKTLVTTDAKVTTADAANVTQVSAQLGGSVTDMPSSGELLTGIVFSTLPEVENVRTGMAVTTQEAAASFSLAKAGLLPGTTYYYAAFLDLGSGIVFGDVKSFTTGAHQLDVNEDFVDLGLSTKWCKYNLGAVAENQLGGLFGFGDITGTCNTQDAADYASADIYRTANDLANKIYGQTTLPSASEFEELFQRCSYVWTEKDGVAGLEFTGPNGNKLFLPASGERTGDAIGGQGVLGAYMTGSINPSTPTACISYRFSQSGGDKATSAVYTGLAIRPVSTAKNVQFDKSLLCQTWHIDLRADGSHAFFAGPAYFYGTDDSWRSVTNGEPVVGDSWAWEADYAGNSWIVGEEPRDFGSMTFTEDGKVVVTKIAADGTPTTQEGTYTVDETNKTITLSVDILGIPTQMARGENYRTKLNILSLTESSLQLAIMIDGNSSQVSFNYVPESLYGGIEVQFTICDSNWASSWPDAKVSVLPRDFGTQQSVKFSGSRADGMIVLLDAIAMSQKFPEYMVRIDDIKVDGHSIAFDGDKFYYGDIENNGNFRVEMFNIYGKGTANDSPFGGTDSSKEPALGFNESIEVLFTIVPKPAATLELTVCDSNWASSWPDATTGFSLFDDGKPVAGKEFTISFDGARANGMIYLVEAKGLKAACPNASMMLKSVAVDGQEVAFDASKILRGDLENNGTYRIELYNTYGGSRGNAAFAGETADGIIPALGFNSNITVKMTVDKLF